MKAFRMKSRVFLTALAIACSGLLVGVVILLSERTGQRTLSGREGDTTLSLPVNQTDENVRREAAASTQPQRANIGHTGLAGVSEEYEGPKPRPEGRPDGVVLDRRDDPMDADGILRRVSLIETDLKYPQVLVADHVALGKDGEEIHISRVAMAAGHFLARPAPGVDPDDLRLAFEGLGFKILRASPVDGLMRISLPEVGIETLVQALSTVAEHNLPVAFAEPDFLVFTQTIPSDPGFQQLWGLHNTGQTGGLPGADISALEAWGVSVGDSSLVVGVIDTGIDYDHPDLVANIWNNPVEIPDGTDTSGNGFVDDIVGWNFYADNSNPMDDHYHGTHVAGTIGAVGDNAIGIAGVAWDVRLMALKFLSRDGIGFASDAVAAIDYATGAGVALTCNSWGGGNISWRNHVMGASC